MTLTYLGDRVLVKPAYLQDGDSAFGIATNTDGRTTVVVLDSGRAISQPGLDWFVNIEHIEDEPRDTIEETETPRSDMTDPTLPSETPNVIITNPTVRKWVGNILGAATVILSIATVVDGAISQVDYADVTGPAAIIIAGILGIFQITVTSSNIPKE